MTTNKTTVLITGANGEVGTGLIEYLSSERDYDIVALDLRKPEPELEAKCLAFYQGDILDHNFLEHISSKHRFKIIFHLASLLSTSGERNPDLAHRVNVDGARNIFEIGMDHSRILGEPCRFVFSSSIAAYGMRPYDDQTEPVKTRNCLTPTTIYGITKLYVEQLGNYYSDFYRMGEEDIVRIDFRCVRFPGLISPHTAPSGGTSDYGPEMLHAAAAGKDYASFVAPETQMPFMVMSDAIRSLIQISEVAPSQLTKRIYNVTAFSVTAEQIRQEVIKHFPDAKITYDPNPMRQAIVNSWPKDMDDKPARRDWGWEAKYGFEAAFADLLVPHVKARYQK